MLLQHTHTAWSCAVMHYSKHGKAAASAAHYSDPARILNQKPSPATFQVINGFGLIQTLRQI